MKANEIMIGDWVLHFGEVARIVGIRIDNYNNSPYFKTNLHDTWYESGVDGIEPIPLTPEILEKNGCSREKSNTASMFAYSEYRDNKGDFDLYICNGVRRGSSCEEINEFQFTAIRFVHELQHALKLCKIDKEIVL